MAAKKAAPNKTDVKGKTDKPEYKGDVSDPFAGSKAAPFKKGSLPPWLQKKKTQAVVVVGKSVGKK